MNGRSVPAYIFTNANEIEITENALIVDGQFIDMDTFGSAPPMDGHTFDKPRDDDGACGCNCPRRTLLGTRWNFDKVLSVLPIISVAVLSVSISICLLNMRHLDILYRK